MPLAYLEVVFMQEQMLLSDGNWIVLPRIFFDRLLLSLLLSFLFSPHPHPAHYLTIAFSCFYLFMEPLKSWPFSMGGLGAKLLSESCHSSGQAARFQTDAPVLLGFAPSPHFRWKFLLLQLNNSLWPPISPMIFGRKIPYLNRNSLSFQKFAVARLK